MSASNIKEFKRGLDTDLVAFLERALENVKSGETTGAMIIEQHTDGFSWSQHGLRGKLPIVGSLQLAIHKLLES